MQLRTKIRRPGRYRESEVKDLPPNPKFVVPTITFNPTLRPAVFPTLRWDKLGPDHPAYAAKESERVEKQSLEEGSVSKVDGRVRKDTSARHAIVFRENRTVPIMETEEGLVQMEDGTWLATEEPANFDAFAGIWKESDIGSETPERWFPPVFTEQKYWSDLSNSMHLILMQELTAHMTFYDTVLFLQLGQKELEDFLNLCADELHVRETKGLRIARAHERQMAVLDGDWSTDDWGKIFEEETNRTEEASMPSTFLITREEVIIAKNYLRNYRSREEYVEQIKDNHLDEVEPIPEFAVFSSIIDRLDSYIGVDTMVKELKFGPEFLDYLPAGGVVASEEIHEITNLQKNFEVLAQKEPAASVPPVQAPPTTPRPSPASPPTLSQETPAMEKDSLTGMDVIHLELIKKNKKCRSRKSDIIGKAGPSRLREVMNAEDISSPSHSPSSTPAQDAVSTPPIETPHRPATSLAFRKVSSVARNPFGPSPSTPPPAHSALFPDNLPAQPALTSLPKLGTVSPPRNVKGAQLKGLPLYCNDGIQAIGVKPYHMEPAGSLAFPVSSMSRAAGANLATEVPISSFSQESKRKTETSSRVLSTTQFQSTDRTSPNASTPGTASISSSSSHDLSSLAQFTLNHMGTSPFKDVPASYPSPNAVLLGGQTLSVISTPPIHSPHSEDIQVSRSNSSFASSGVRQPCVLNSAPSAHPLPPESTEALTLGPNLHFFIHPTNISQGFVSALPVNQRNTSPSTSAFGVLVPDASSTTKQVSGPASQPSQETTLVSTTTPGAHKYTSKASTAAYSKSPKVKEVSGSFFQPATSLSLRPSAVRSPQSSSHLTSPQSFSTKPISPSQLAPYLAIGLQTSPLYAPEIIATPQILVTEKISAPHLAVSPVGNLPRTLTHDYTQTNQPWSPYNSPYRNKTTLTNAVVDSQTKPAPRSSHVNALLSFSTNLPANVTLTNVAAESPANSPAKSLSTTTKSPSTIKRTPKDSPTNTVAPPALKAKHKPTLTNATTRSASKPTPEVRPANVSAPPPKSASKNKITPTNALSQPKAQITPGKLIFNAKRSRASTPTSLSHLSVFNTPEASSGKRPCNEECRVDLSDERATKKPRLEQHEPKNSSFDKAKGIMRKISNILTGSKDAVVESGPRKLLDIGNDALGGFKTQPNTLATAPISESVAAPNFTPNDTIQGEEVTSRMTNPTENVDSAQFLPIFDNYFPPSQTNHLNAVQDASTRTRQILTMASSITNPPSKTKEQSSSNEEATKDADQQLPQQVAAKTNGAVDDTKIIGAPPPIIAGKAQSETKHAGVNSQSSTEITGRKRARTSTLEPSRTDLLAERRKTIIEVQIPAPKRAAFELSAPSFEREGSPNKRLKATETSPYATTANDSTRTDPEAQQKGPNARRLKKQIGQIKPAQPPEAHQNGDVSSSTAPPEDSRPAKMRKNTQKDSGPTNALAPAIVTPQLEFGPKSNAANQPKTTTTAVAVKIKAKPKPKAEKEFKRSSTK